MAHDIFICHASEDRAIADAVVAGLEQGGISCWVAPRDVMAGADYAQAIVAGISGAQALVLVFSGHSNASPHVSREVERAASRGIGIIPYRVEEVVPSPSLEYFISNAQWLDATTSTTEESIAELARTIRVGVGLEQDASPRQVTGEMLRQIIDRYGTDVVDDPRRVQALLRDMAGEHRAEVAVLVAAAEEGVGANLLQSSQGLAPEAAQRLARRLEESRSLTEDAASWAVAAWLGALGLEEPSHADMTRPVENETDETVAAVASRSTQQPSQPPPRKTTPPAPSPATVPAPADQPPPLPRTSPPGREDDRNRNRNRIYAFIGGGALLVAAIVGAVALTGGSKEAVLTSAEQVPINEVTARLIANYPLSWSTISPDGSLLLGQLEDGVQDDVSATVCLIEVGNPDRAADLCSTGLKSEGYDFYGAPAWSPSGDGVAWPWEFDVWGFDLSSGLVVGITDDGLDDLGEDLGQAPYDSAPTWLNDTELVFVRRDSIADETALVTWEVGGEATGTVVGPTFIVSQTERVVSEWEAPLSPPLIAEGKAYLNGRGVIYEVDVSAAAYAVLGDLGDEYVSISDAHKEVGGFLSDPGGLVPVGFTPSGDLLIWDFAPTAHANGGTWSGAPSGAFLLNRDNQLTPILATSPPTDGYLGPVAVGLSPSGTRLAIMWLDDAQRGPTGFPTTRLSLLDLETAQLPVNARALPELWSFTETPALGADYVLEWTTNDRLAFWTFEEGTSVLQLEAPPG
ncbi:MAG: toll/interleukin-1 receptor domain-containing protein [bacterium]|nr:toll/interleukin-1 receptor domain-containing protein [bacterium]